MTHVTLQPSSQSTIHPSFLTASSAEEHPEAEGAEAGAEGTAQGGRQAMSREEEGEDDGVDKQGRLLLVPCMERCGVYCLSNKAPRYFFRVFYVVEYTM